MRMTRTQRCPGIKRTTDANKLRARELARARTEIGCVSPWPQICDESAEADKQLLRKHTNQSTHMPRANKPRNPRNYKAKQNKMSCQRCPQLRVELQRTQDNVRLIEDLLEDAKNRDKNLQDTLDRLAMLHKHCRTNYKDMANLTFALNHCQNQPRCPRL